MLWEREAPRNRSEKLDNRNHPASPSAAADGERVYFFFADYGLLAYDVNGKELWRQPLGPFNNVYGMGASPIVVDDVVVLTCDQSTGSFIAAFDKKTGRERWRTPRVEARSGHSTPVIYAPPGGRAQVVVPGSFLLSAYDPRDGKRIWWVGGLSFELKSTPVISGDTLYINGFGSPENQPGAKLTIAPTVTVFGEHDAEPEWEAGGRRDADQARARLAVFFDLNGDGSIDRGEWDYYKAAMESENGMLAIKLGGSGDMTATAVRWRYQRGIPQLPSPLLFRNALYMVNDAGGLVTTLNPQTGALIQQGRLKVPSDRYYASPVAGDGKVFIASESGKVVVLPPGGGLDRHCRERSAGQHLRHPCTSRRAHLCPHAERPGPLRPDVARVAPPPAHGAGRLTTALVRLYLEKFCAFFRNAPAPYRISTSTLQVRKLLRERRIRTPDSSRAYRNPEG